MRCEGEILLGGQRFRSFQARSDALRNLTVICDEFMTHLFRYFAITCYPGCYLFVVVLPGLFPALGFFADDVRGPFSCVLENMFSSTWSAKLVFF